MKITKETLTLCIILIASMTILALAQTASAADNTVQFVANGMPSGTLWWVNLNGNTLFSTTNVITFTGIADGSFAWTAQTPVSGSTGTRYVTSVSTGTITAPGNPQQINYTSQYQVAFAQSGVGTDFAGNVMSVNGSLYTRTGTQAWYNNGDTLVFSYTSPLAAVPTLKQYVLTGTGSVTSPLTVSAPTTVTGAYKTQWNVSFVQTGVGTDYAAANVVTVGSSSYDRNGYSAWFDDGASVTFTYNTPLTAQAQVKQYVLTGTSTTSPLTVSAATLVTGTYKTQVNVTFIQSGVGTDFTGNVMTVASTSYDRNGYSAWFDNNTAVTFSYTSPLTVTAQLQQYLLASTNATSPYTIVNRTTVTGTYKNQFNVTVTQTGISSDLATNFFATSNVTGTTTGVTYTGVSGWFNSSDRLAFVYNSTALVISNFTKQYLLVGSANGTTNSVISAPTVINGNFKTQYYVQFNQTGLGTDLTGTTTLLTVNGPTGSNVSYNRNTFNLTAQNWYDNGTTLNFNYFNATVTANSRMYGLQGVNATTGIVVNSRLTLLAAYWPMWYVSFTQSGVGTDYTSPNVLTLAGTYAYDRTGAVIWWNENTTLSYTWNNTLVIDPTVKQYINNATLNDTNTMSPLTITNKTSVVQPYITQYRVNFTQTGLGTMFNPTVLTLNGTSYTSIQLGNGIESWWTSGDKINMAFATPLAVNATTQYVGSCNNTVNPTNLTVSGRTTINCTYTLQYYLTVNDITNTATGAGWYNNGTTATFAVSPNVAAGTGQQYRFNGWTGNATSSTASTSIVMTSANSETANWVTQYLVTVNSPYGNPGGAGWYDAGATATIGIDAQDATSDGVLQIFTSWSDGNTNPSFTVTVTAPKTYTAANWKTQYYLTVVSDVGSPTGAGWYDSGATASFAVTSPVTAGNATGTQYVFTTWQGGVSSTTASSSVVMDGPKTVTAHWQTQYQVTVTGSATGGGWVNAGASTTVSSPSDSDWKINDQSAGTGTSVTTAVNQPLTIDAQPSSGSTGIGNNTMLILLVAGVIVAFVVILGTLVYVLRKPKQ